MNIHLTARVKKVLLAVGSIGIAALVFASIASASASDNLVGYGWSSNIGWISVNNCDSASPQNCTSGAYGLTMATTGTTRAITGYAWSSNLGWISFNPDVSNCPTLPSCQTANAAWGASGGSAVPLSGWVRVCSVFQSGCSGDYYHGTGLVDNNVATNPFLGGWDGWISLGNPAAPVPFGATLNTTTGVITGDAWGSDVVGWVDLSGMKVNAPSTASCTDGIQNQGETGVDTGGPCAPTVTLTANPNPVLKSGDTTMLTWTVGWQVVNVANQCTATGAWSGSKNINGGSQTSGAISGPTTFIITCSGPGGTGTAQVAVTVSTSGALCPDGTPAPGGNVNNCTSGALCPDGTPAPGGDVTQCTGSGSGDLCPTYPPGIQTSPLPPHYKVLTNGSGRCACDAGYVMNSSYQCVKPVFQEH